MTRRKKDTAILLILFLYPCIALTHYWITGKIGTVTPANYKVIRTVKDATGFYSLIVTNGKDTGILYHLTAEELKIYRPTVSKFNY